VPENGPPLGHPIPVASLSAADHVRAGEAHFQAGDLESAREAFLAAVESDPACAAAYNNLGVIYCQLGNLVVATGYLHLALDLEPRNRETVINLGNILEMQGMRTEARKVYFDHMLLDPDDVEVFERLAAVTSQIQADAKDDGTLPVHFFTIVLNGEPFIRYHLDVLRSLPFRWHWHIIEGLAEPYHDTAWPLANGQIITPDMHQFGLSNDGTSDYLDDLVEAYPDQITLYRKPTGQTWRGKIEMVNAPLQALNEVCLLWQIDVDELWTRDQLIRMREMFLAEPERTAAFYWCHFFVGEDLAISTRHCYAQRPEKEWLRTWRYRPGMIWFSHAPPWLSLPGPKGWSIVSEAHAFSHAETEAAGLVFQHYAYATEEQVAFKERYYGYHGAVAEWERLNQARHAPLRLGDYLHWVQDETRVDRLDRLGIVPLARRDPATGEWRFAH
jgi:hypothetical protein